jgi:TPR repeat protein
MAQRGFVYALTNPNMEGLVKVGHTTRDPTGRTHELSSATEEPTAFVLAYRRSLYDAEAAARFVHQRLEQNGCRLVAGEFFRAPLEEVIGAILEAPQSTTESTDASEQEEAPISDDTDEFLDSLTLQDNVWDAVYDEATNYYLGWEGHLQDYKEALKLFKQAAELGAAKAYRDIGGMYRDGEGCTQNRAKALDYFKEGARCGDINCYGEMAEMFGTQEQWENASKCWNRFFTASIGDEPRSILLAYHYFTRVVQQKIEMTHGDKLRAVLPDLRSQAQQMITSARDRYPAILGLYENVAQEIEKKLATE